MEDLLEFTHTIDEEDSQLESFEQRRPDQFDGAILQDVTQNSAQKRNKQSALPNINQNISSKERKKLEAANRLAERISKVKGMKEVFLRDYFVKDTDDAEPSHTKGLYSTSKKIQERIVEK